MGSSRYSPAGSGQSREAPRSSTGPQVVEKNKDGNFAQLQAMLQGKMIACIDDLRGCVNQENIGLGSFVLQLLINIGSTSGSNSNKKWLKRFFLSRSVHFSSFKPQVMF